METIHVVLESELVRAVDSVAKRARVDRSAFVRKALREHLRRLKIKELEARERCAYKQHPQAVEEVERWVPVAVWPKTTEVGSRGGREAAGPSRADKETCPPTVQCAKISRGKG